MSDNGYRFSDWVALYNRNANCLNPLLITMIGEAGEKRKDSL